MPVSGNVGGQPYNCTSGGTSLFTDVAPTDIFCKSVHYIYGQNVTSGCGPGLYCPTQNVPARRDGDLHREGDVRRRTVAARSR